MEISIKRGNEQEIHKMGKVLTPDSPDICAAYIASYIENDIIVKNASIKIDLKYLDYLIKEMNIKQHVLNITNIKYLDAFEFVLKTQLMKLDYLCGGNLTCSPGLIEDVRFMLMQCIKK